MLRMGVEKYLWESLESFDYAAVATLNVESVFGACDALSAQIVIFNYVVVVCRIYFIDSGFFGVSQLELAEALLRV